MAGGERCVQEVQWMVMWLLLSANSWDTQWDPYEQLGNCLSASHRNIPLLICIPIMFLTVMLNQFLCG